jgi:hypothetical protein
MLESKGFVPHYYYSGNKSIHIHVYLDFKEFLTLDGFVQERILDEFQHRTHFVKQFMKWLRRTVITQWGTNTREFDMDLAEPKHLIRAEGGRNGKGFKTFLGYTWKDCPFVPYVCNEKNRLYPEIGEIRLSRPHDIQGLVREYLEYRDRKKGRDRVRRKERALMDFDASAKEGLKPCVKYIMSNAFRENDDGFKRAAFILANELRREYGQEQAHTMVLNWNERMGAPVGPKQLEYRIWDNKLYELGCRFVHDFLRSIGAHDALERCNQKV